jgi:hypothetical protein
MYLILPGASEGFDAKGLTWTLRACLALGRSKTPRRSAQESLGARKHCAGAIRNRWALKTAAPSPSEATEALENTAQVRSGATGALEDTPQVALGRSKMLHRCPQGPLGRPLRCAQEPPGRSKAIGALKPTVQKWQFRKSGSVSLR